MSQLRRFVLTALFVALIVLFGMTPVGMIPLGFVNISLLAIPVVVGTLLLGWKEGLVLGFSFGLVSALSAFGIVGTPSTLAGNLVAESPVLALIMCFVPRLLIPIVTTLVYRLAAGKAKYSKRALPFAAAAGSLTNTVFYLGLMLLFYWITGIDSRAVLALIGGTGLIAGASEAVANALITTPVMLALWRMLKYGG